MRSVVLAALLSLASAAATPSNCIVATTADCSNKFFASGFDFFQLSCGASVSGTSFADVSSVADFASCISSCGFNTACSIVRFDAAAKVCHMYGPTASVSTTASTDNVAIKLAGDPCVSTTTTSATVKPTSVTTTLTTFSTKSITTTTTTSTSSATVKPSSTTTTQTSSGTTSTTTGMGKPTSSTTTMTTTTTTTNGPTIKPTSTSTDKSTSSTSTWTQWTTTTPSVWTTWSGIPWTQWTTTTPHPVWSTWSAVKPTPSSWNKWAPGVTVVYVTTSYIDICPTGYTTIPFTTAVTVTITGKTTPTGNYVWPTQSNGCPSGYYTKTTVCNQGCGLAPTTVVVTLPLAPGATSTWVSWATGTPAAATSTGAWNSWNGVNVYQGAASNVETKSVVVMITAFLAGLLAM